MKHYRILTLIFLLFLTACSQGEIENNFSAPNENSSIQTAENSAVDNNSIQNSQEDTEPDTNAFFPVILLNTPQTNAGTHPLFSWEPVAEAANYQLILFSADGRGYWAWEGKNSFIYLGGTESQPADDSSGPALTDEMTWQVMAFDKNNLLIAISEVQNIAP